MRFLRVRNGCDLTAAFSVSYRVLCLVPAFSSVCFDGSFPKGMAKASDGSTSTQIELVLQSLIQHVCVAFTTDYRGTEDYEKVKDATIKHMPCPL